MVQDSVSSGELSQKEKILLARGAAAASAFPQLSVLVGLTDDSDEEVRRAAEETLRLLPDEACARQLASPSLEESVARYFLVPSRLRPTLLPVLLANPRCPQEAVVALAAQAGAGVIPVLLEYLDLLKTPALVALKKNPSYLAWEQAAARPALPLEEKLAIARETKQVPEEQRLSLLVSLAADSHDEVRRAAQETLDRLPDEDCADTLASESLEDAVARYFLRPAHVRTVLLPILLANPASPPDAVAALAGKAGPEVIPVLLDNVDLLKTPALVSLRDNPAYLEWQKEPPTQGLVIEVDLLEMLIEESEAEALQPAAAQEELAEELEEAGEAKPEGMVKKIARMNVAQRVKLALLGNREERAMLIRDSSKVITRAVLSSPKLTDSEVEGFATMKNVSQDVLRLIAMNRKFMKNYIVMKNLVMNPRLSIDVALPLLNRLLPNDLRAVAGSKEVPDTTRKMAQKLSKAKQQKG